MLSVLLLWLVGCQQAESPAACDQMCASAAALYGGCLEDWGVDWSAAGYDGEDGFSGSCETWGWEMSLLQEDAIARGVWEESGWLSSVCTERRDALSDEEATCAAYTDIEWNDIPWSPDDTGR
jgi:hypothetical protein